MKLSQVAGFTNPLNGSKGSMLNPGDWISNIMGVLFILVVFATGQNLAKVVSSRVPAIDSSIDPIINRPVTQTSQRVFL